MSLILVTGSNLQNPEQNLKQVETELKRHFHFIAKSKIYSSKAVDFLDQDDFLNQALEFSLPNIKPEETLSILQSIENEMGREKKIPKGPRIIDIDIIFWSHLKINKDGLTIPHPAWSQRAFVVKPVQELPAYQLLRNYFNFPVDFDNIATPL